MRYGVVDDEVASLRECLDCGLLQALPKLAAGDVARCGRCNAALRHAHERSLIPPVICLVLAGVLFVLTLTLPLMGVHALGRASRATILTAAGDLFAHGAWPLALLAYFTLVVAPAFKILGTAIVLVGVQKKEPHPHLALLFGWLLRLGPWAMPEVFLIGAFVAYTRLSVLADVNVGPAVIGLGGVMLALVGADASIDRQTVWSKIRWRMPSRSRPQGAGKLACHVCRLVQHAHEGDRCARCWQKLEARKPKSVERTAALVAAAAILYLPANLLPVMTATRLGHGGPTTILNGVVELFSSGMWPLGMIVLLASFAVPLLKLAGLATMLILIRRKSDARLVARTRLYRFIEVIGRWSMIDIFVLMVLVSLVRLGVIASVLPGGGALAFAAVVLLTMLATEAFDPRLMWDAVQANRDQP